MADPFPCPKCGDLLAASGTLYVDGEKLPVYQCDRCVMVVDFEGEGVETALTFARRGDGEIVDAADPGRVLRF